MHETHKPGKWSFREAHKETIAGTLYPMRAPASYTAIINKEKIVITRGQILAKIDKDLRNRSITDIPLVERHNVNLILDLLERAN